MKPIAFLALLAVLCPSFLAAQDANPQEVSLKGLSVRLSRPVQVTGQVGWRISGPEFDHWSFIHITPMLARFPKGEFIATYALDPDTQKNPYFLSAFQISRDGGEHWGPRYSTLMQHIPMIFIPQQPDSLIAVPSELMADQPESRALHGPYLRFDQGGKKIVMEPEGVHVVDWPWPLEPNRNTQPESNWHYNLVLTGDAIKVKGRILATAYWWQKGEKYANGLLSSNDNGHTWRYYSTIATAADVLPQDQWTQKGFEGPDEPAMIRLAGGDLMAVFRVGSGLAWKLRRSYSHDNGRTWTKPDTLPAWSVEPKLVRMGNGVIALSSGRPGVGLWLSTDPRAQSWQHIDIAAIHNRFYNDPVHRITPLDAAHPEKAWQTTSYTGLVAVDSNRLLLAYDRDPEKAPSGPEDLSRVLVMTIEVNCQ